MSSNIVLSQENDFQSWHVLSANKKLYKRTTLNLKTGIRLKENSRLYSKQFTDLRIKRKFSKSSSFAFGYRYAINFNDKLEISNKHRFYGDLNYKKKIFKRFSYSLRNRLQRQSNSYDYKITLRQKSSIIYNIRKTKLTPSIGTEYFLNFEYGISKLRSTFTLSYPIIKQLKFDLAYRIQQQFFVNNPQTLFIFEGKLIYDL